MKKSNNIYKVNYQKETYAFYINFIITTLLNKEQLYEYNKISSLYNTCFIKAKQNKLVEAQEAYKDCYEIGKRISAALCPWTTIFCDPFLSYYHYKVGNYKKAISLTENIIKMTIKLQNEGYKYLFFSEIQQQQNLGRIYFFLDDMQKAVLFAIKCLEDIVKHSNNWSTKTVINGVPEQELIEITQYLMIIQVITEIFSRLMKKFNEDAIGLEKWLGICINRMLKLNLKLMSSDLRYKNCHRFLLIMKNLLDKGIDSIGADDLLFINAPNTDKNLIKVLYNYANLLNKRETIAAQNMEKTASVWI